MLTWRSYRVTFMVEIKDTCVVLLLTKEIEATVVVSSREIGGGAVLLMLSYTYLWERKKLLRINYS